MRQLSGLAWHLAGVVAAPGLRLMLRRRARRGREIADRLPERYGLAGTARPPGKLLWLHAASVGETLSVLPLLAALPGDITILFTTGTVTSAELLARRLPEMGLQDRVFHRFVPLDVPHWATRFLDHWRPDAACFVESELWPNLLAACRRRGIGLALVNARLSAGTARAWGRLPGLAREVLAGFSLIAAQSPADAARLRALGAEAAEFLGDLKEAAPPLPADSAALAELSGQLAGRPCWLAASTHPGDEPVIAEAHQLLRQRLPNLLTIIVPRHPERGAALSARLAAPRRALNEAPPAQGIYIADTLGELGLFYRAVPIVLMGKSFGKGGGQNPLEPARLGCAIAAGPAMTNFAAATARLARAGGLTQLADAPALAAWVGALLSEPAARAAMGRAAAAAACENAQLPGILAARLTQLIAARHHALA
jgi:3-deoxy-D-manno-octulosonic-acid transferase